MRFINDKIDSEKIITRNYRIHEGLNHNCFFISNYATLGT